MLDAREGAGDGGHRVRCSRKRRVSGSGRRGLCASWQSSDSCGRQEQTQRPRGMTTSLLSATVDLRHGLLERREEAHDLRRHRLRRLRHRAGGRAPRPARPVRDARRRRARASQIGAVGGVGDMAAGRRAEPGHVRGAHARRGRGHHVRRQAPISAPHARRHRPRQRRDERGARAVRGGGRGRSSGGHRGVGAPDDTGGGMGILAQRGVSRRGVRRG